MAKGESGENIAGPRPRVLVLIGAYLPGWRAGGPIRSLSNLVAELGGEFDFRIITRDRDHTATAPYPGIPLDEWATVGNARVWYGRPRALGTSRLSALISSCEPDLVVLNSFHSSLTVKYLVSRRLRPGLRVPALLAPQGEFAPSALSIKKAKKRPFLGLAKLVRLVEGVHWQAASSAEKQAIEAAFPRACIHVVSDVPRRPGARALQPLSKKPGQASFAFISRISRMKNLPFLLEVLSEVKGDVALDVYGPREATEWTIAERLIGSLPDNLRVAYRGVLKHEEIDRALAQAHFFVLPTLGENFGHAIYEALSVGRPVIISDRTPWRGLAKVGAGWDLALENRGAWVDTLQQSVDIDDSSYRLMADAAHAYATRWFRDAHPAAQQAAVFRNLLGG